MAAKSEKKGGSRKPPAAPAGAGGLELDARRSGRLQTAGILKPARTPLTVIAAAGQAADLAEGAVREAKRRWPPPPSACQEGCDWCCYLLVGTSVPEVARIVEHLRQTLSPEELRALRERVVRQDEQRRALKGPQRAAAHLPCALLVGRRCSAYPVRPLTCRGFNSADARRCELSVTSGARVAVPAYAPQLRLNTFVLDGLREGLAAAGLSGDLLELNAALRIALEVPDAVERWLAGEAVFAAARLD
jgi:Fe-S-cluster containining protein